MFDAGVRWTSLTAEKQLQHDQTIKYTKHDINRIKMAMDLDKTGSGTQQETIR